MFYVPGFLTAGFQRLVTGSRLLFEFSPERFSNPIVIVGLIFAFLAFVFTLATTKIANAITAKREYADKDEREAASQNLSIKLKIPGVTVLVAASLAIILSL